MSVETQLLGLKADKDRGLPARYLAYRHRAGKGPAVIWLGGFRSDMTSTKAAALDDACAADGRAMLRFDYFAHGESKGDFLKANLSIWLDDALQMIRQFGGPPGAGRLIHGRLDHAARHAAPQSRGTSAVRPRAHCACCGFYRAADVGAVP